MKQNLTFIDSANDQDIATVKIEKYVLQHKNICKRAKTVVILHPQSGLRPTVTEPVAERTLTTMPQDNAGKLP